MRYLSTIALGILLLLISFSLVQAQQDNFKEVEDLVIKSIEEGSLVGIAVGYISPKGDILYLTEGTLSNKTEKAVDKNSIFKIASITKVFTSLALARFLDEQDVSLNDNAEQFLPSDFSLPDYEGKEITLEHLVTHTSGLPRLPGNLEMKDIQNPYGDYSEAKLKSFLADHELQREPGSAFEYSNLGVAVVGHILEEQYGMEYDQVIREQIATPLDMKSTGIYLASADSSRYTQGHFNGNIVPYWDFPGVEAMGALSSSVSDMSKFMQAQIDPESTDMSDAILKTHELRFDISDENPKLLDNIGMGWLLSTEQDSIMWHNGGTGGYYLFAGLNIEKEIGVVVMSNTRSSIDYIGFHLLDNKHPLK